ncbi:c2H2-type domain-containing protein [Trichonephila inaurata madagascariensis]|uniref:C2H2-type domain-containing protein n=1 Tax=Trichonephila inaurata madagascariensis TaxID=2747483 RepID=A0A8X6XNT2_9ARAC|nr:c2H2-type domain-containing protein [Trichonephila inaurata madagascariensis]
MDSFRCVECDKTFSTVSNLYRHAKLIHNKVSTIKQVRCNICSAEFISKKALEDHVNLVHNIAIEKDTHTFDTFEDFKLWKESIEKQTSSLYVKNTGSKSEKTGGKITYFYCHRSGYYTARGIKKRKMKIAGSNKINGNCPSKMKVYEDIESKVTVEFTKTHVGHGIDLEQKEISKEEFQKECMQLINKASPEQYDNILTSLRNAIDSSHLFPAANQEIEL